jgi:hypothetical protein
MNFSQPTTLSDALQSWAMRGILPTTLSSEELHALGSAILERSVFSAGVDESQYLDTIYGSVADMLAGKTDFATARLQLKSMADELDIPHDDARIDLILNTNQQVARGVGRGILQQDPAIINLWPALELVRVAQKREPRDWKTRFMLAAQESGDGIAARVATDTGRLAARKDSGIWQALGNGAGGYRDTLGSRFDPLAFNTGMRQREISRPEAIELDIIAPDAKIKPAAVPDLNAGLQMSFDIRDQVIRDLVLEKFGDKVKFANGVLTAS